MKAIKLLISIVFSIIIINGYCFINSDVKAAYAWEIGWYTGSSGGPIVGNHYFLRELSPEPIFDFTKYNYRIYLSSNYPFYLEDVDYNVIATLSTTPVALTQNAVWYRENYPIAGFVKIDRQLKNQNPSIATTTPSQNGAFHTERRAA